MNDDVRCTLYVDKKTCAMLLHTGNTGICGILTILITEGSTT